MHNGGIMKPEYREGPKAKEEFEKTMTALFRAPKNIAKSKPKPKKKKLDSAKD